MYCKHMLNGPDIINGLFGKTFNLENAVGREKDVQAIDLDSVMKKCAVTLLVISTFFI